MQWGMLPVHVLHGFVLFQIRKEGKSRMQEPPSSVVITTNPLVCEQLQQVGHPLKALIY